MHKEFLKLLEKATGRSEHVIAINLDIRGFTPFSQSVDSLDVATYVKKIYAKIINDYFKDASYYKPTGDGLIIIIPYAEATLKDVTNSTIDSCLQLLETFDSLCIGDPMINFPTPKEIGIGITRGSACCITSEDKVLDYSGRVLNLASRLMDLARPSGIVLDDSFRIDLLKDETRRLFSEDVVYIRGTAEEEPIKINYTKKHTLIPDSYHRPLKEPKWNIDEYEYSIEELRSLKKTVKTLSLRLKQKPLDENKIRVDIGYPHPTVKAHTIYSHYSIDDKIEYIRKGNTHLVRMTLDLFSEYTRRRKISGDMKIKIEVVYPTK